VPSVARPDGAEVHWEARGDGRTVIVAPVGYGPPDDVAAMIDDLATDHRVVTMHLRGTGESSRTGPYDFDTDAGDTIAVLEAAGGPAIAVAMGDGTNRSVRAATQRPDVVTHVLVSGTPPIVGRDQRIGGLAGSREVLSALVQLLANDYRAGLHSMLATGDRTRTEEQVRARVDRIVEFAGHEAMVARMQAWIDDDPSAQARALGSRLWILNHRRNPWFGEELLERVTEVFPEARSEEIEDGAMSRPDLTAAAVRRIPR
jgi:pimeloyl-ACP methyl ester carboxylesterase